MPTLAAWIEPPLLAGFNTLCRELAPADLRETAMVFEGRGRDAVSQKQTLRTPRSQPPWQVQPSMQGEADRVLHPRDQPLFAAPGGQIGASHGDLPCRFVEQAPAAAALHPYFGCAALLIDLHA